MPKMDVVGNGDPYFVARLDGKVEYMYAASFGVFLGRSVLMQMFPDRT